MNFSKSFLAEATQIIENLDPTVLEKMAGELAAVRARQGRLFLLGVGGSAAACSHAVNDFRKLAGIETYAPTDNVSELTARTNDEGWSTIFVEWLKTSHLNSKDLVLILSVGGGNLEKNVSPNLVEALKYAQALDVPIAGIVGRDGGYTAQVGDAVVIIPTVNPDHITPHTESFHCLLLHLLVTHPAVKNAPTKWESTVAPSNLS